MASARGLLLWVVALATFVPMVSNDYNFCFLPLTVVAVWDRRDPLLVHVALVLLLLWWQPIAISLGDRTLFWFKLLGLCAAAVSLVERTCELSVKQERCRSENEAIPECSGVCAIH